MTPPDNPWVNATQDKRWVNANLLFIHCNINTQHVHFKLLLRIHRFRYMTPLQLEFH